MPNQNQKGFVPLPLLLIAVVAIIGYLLISSNAPLRSNLFSSLYPKSSSHAAGLSGDIDNNGKVDIFDYNQLLTDFGKVQSGLVSDLDSNGKVDIFDYNILLTNFGQVASTPPFPLYNAAKEVVPDFCTTSYLGSTATIITSKQSGTYSDPNTWNGNVVPTANASVQIQSGHTITYDEDPSVNISLNCLKINEGGSLKFKADANTKLKVGTLTDFGYLEVGTEQTPIQSSKKAEIVIADKPLDINPTTPSSSKDPNQMGTGLLVLKNGKLRIHGEVKTDSADIYNPASHAFVRLSQEPQAGATTLQLTENVLLSNWRAGDKIVLPDSRQATDFSSGYSSFAWHSERPTIQSISSDGKTLTLSAPLQFAHPGAKDADGTMKFLPHIGDMTRNVVIRSENPGGTRGHSLYSERADVDIRYASFNDMGRTDAAVPLDSVAYDATNKVTKIGSNQIGRYAMHFHHDEGAIRTVAQQTDPKVFQMVVVGNVIADTPKWGITIHDSHFGLFKNNLAVGNLGSGIMLEAGNEYKNIIEGNFLVDSHGSPDQGSVGVDGNIRGRVAIGDFGFEGSGIWSMSPFSQMRNNVAAANKDGGYIFFLQSHDDAFLGDFSAQRPNMMVPSKNYVMKWMFAGSNMPGVVRSSDTDPDQGVGRGQDIRGSDMYDMNQTTTVVTGVQRLMEFKDNEAYGVTERGLHLWSGGPGTTIDTFRAWNTHFAGLMTSIQDYDGIFYDSTAMQFKNIIVRGDPNAFKNMDAGNWDRPDGGYFGMELESFQYSNNSTLTNIDIQGMRVGTNSTGASLRVNNATLKNFYNFQPHIALERMPRNIVMTNVSMAPIPNFSIPGKTSYNIDGATSLAVFDHVVNGNPPRLGIGELWHGYTHPDIIRFYGLNLNGTNMGDVRYYYAQQAPNFDMKQTAESLRNEPNFPSITNQNSWNQYGNAIADAVAACATTHSSITGFLCPLSNPATAPGPQVYGDVLGRSNASSYNYSVNDVYTQYTLPLTSYPAGNNFITITDANIPASDQLSVLDLNKNGVIDSNERFKKTFVIFK